jgi:type I restriction enzyme M protein
MDILQKAVEQNLISFDEERKFITYVHQNKRRNFHNPEEKVQAETFCRLILEYGYSEKRIEQFVEVKMGTATKEADIFVYHDDECLQPYIVVECKSPEVSEMEFQEAVKQAKSYAHAKAGITKFIWVTKGNKQEFYRFSKDTEKVTIEADIPYYGKTSAKKYKYAKNGYYTDKVKGKDERITTGDINKVGESELTRIFKQAHDALWGGGQLNPSQAFDELDKLIFCKVWDERYTKKGEPYKFQIYSSSDNKDAKDEYAKNLASLKQRIDELYNKGKETDKEIFNKPIDLDPEKIKTVVEYFQGINFTDTDLDSKGKAFETFLGTYFRGEFGQYFTPRNVVKFAVEVLPITNESRVLDTSCGSGGFLLYVLDKVRRQADAEFNVEIPKEAVEHYNQWHDFAAKNLFGIEINDQISRVAKMNMIIHDDGHTNVVTYDGLFQIDHIAQVKDNKGFAENSFDYIVTNPPFGSIVKQSEKSYMQVDKATAPYYNFATKEVNWIEEQLKGKHTATGRENQSTEILFIEQCHKFLKSGGYLAVVVPDGILTNSSSQYVRNRIEENFRIVAVVSLPQTAFTNTGAGVKSSVMFLKKHTQQTTEKIRNKKAGIAEEIGKKQNLKKTIEDLETKKRELLKPLKAKDEETLAKRKQISDEYSEKIGSFKEDLEERYQTAKQKELLDYPIFMAIAENIGYDAAGKNSYKILSKEETKADNGDKIITEVQENDLFTSKVVRTIRIEGGKETEILSKEEILPDTGIIGELHRFILSIEKGKDSFFVSALS